MKGFTWTADESVIATAQVAHFGSTSLKNQPSSWAIRDQQGKRVALGDFDPLDIPTGGLTELGTIELACNTLPAPSQLNLEISLNETEFANDWDFWVYPAQVDTAAKEVVIANDWDKQTKQILADGGRVLLLPAAQTLANVEETRWHSVFWSHQLFASQPKTMGILCDPKHSALAQFPTEFFGNWQWHDLLENAEALVMDKTPSEFRPLVQFVPDFNTNLKMSAISEAQVGKGRLMICTIDLQNKMETRPVARQLLHSLLSYMNTPDFNPAHTLDVATLDKVLQPIALLQNQAAPENMDSAVLNIRAAVNAPLAKPEPWETSADNVIALNEGFGYAVQGQIWRDQRSSAWHNPHLVVKVTCPMKFEGTFYAHFHDWDNQKRAAALFFGGRDLGPLSRYDRQGFWLKIPVTAEMTTDGHLTLDARVTSGPNVMISQIVFIPK